MNTRSDLTQWQCDSAGATAVRRSAAKTILDAGQIDVIKGNRSEILACLPGNLDVLQRGVDSAEDDSGPDARTVMTKLAKERNAIVVMTGKEDYVTNGSQMVKIGNGHEYQAAVTGTGCCLGTTISAMVAAYPEDKFTAAMAALLHYNIAAEIAAERTDVKGPGTFVPAFLDELYNIRIATAKGDLEWFNRARVTEVPCRLEAE
jgi:thiamine-phosphate diphosphorylase / hydroxyethylthiazole kinase